METRVAEIAEGTYQLNTYIPEADFSFNQYLITGDDPLLFHCGSRKLFPLVSAAVGRVLPVERLRWITFGHVEADECGAMNEWLAAAPDATVAQSRVGCIVSVADLADREPRPLDDGEVLDIGGHELRWIDTPHVPHAWEAGLIYDETTRTLFCGDLFTRTGAFPAASNDDLVDPAIAAENLFHASSLAPGSGGTVRALGELGATTLAPMHAPAFGGDCAAALDALAADFDRRIVAAAS